MNLNLKSLPQSPGIYKFFSKEKIIYIGKAKNLKKRVSSYFGNSVKDRKTEKIKLLTDKVETFSTLTEAEALILEQSLIKENLPRFNILLRDDKTYPYIYFSMNHKFPGISLKRSKNAVSKNYFGPFISSQGVRSSIKDLQKIYRLRNCSDSTFNNRSRPCIEYQMNRCSAPCVNLIPEQEYSNNISLAQQYLSATGKQTKKLMTMQMKKFSDQQDFEHANEIKKQIERFESLKKDQAFHPKIHSVDFFSYAVRHGKTGASILSIRDGKIRGAKTYYFNDDFSFQLDNLFQSLILSFYQNAFSLPKKILVTKPLIDPQVIKEAILLKFGKNVVISTKISSTALRLMQLSTLNASQAIENKIKKSDKYHHAILDLITKLKIDKSLIDIEGYDISHYSGSSAVASCVKFTITGPDKKSYRLFNIPKDLAGNDIGSIEHVLKRRIKSQIVNPLPDIILIDGGQAQLNIALKVFHKLTTTTPLILSIVKGSKRVRATETILSANGILEMTKDSPGFMLLQQVRDESHRFAITASRKKKLKTIKFSKLESIPGIGPLTRERLLKKFKTISALKHASLTDLSEVKGISSNSAETILKYFIKL
jgi:excinuclease ABC subunit C